MTAADLWPVAALLAGAIGVMALVLLVLGILRRV